MFLLVSGRHVGAHEDGHQHGVSIQISINLGKKFLHISRIRKIAVPRILARVFAYLPSFISQILDFIYWPVLFFILIYFELRDTENQQSTKVRISLCLAKLFSVAIGLSYYWRQWRWVFCKMPEINVFLHILASMIYFLTFDFFLNVPFGFHGVVPWNTKGNLRVELNKFHSLQESSWYREKNSQISFCKMWKQKRH